MRAQCDGAAQLGNPRLQLLQCVVHKRELIVRLRIVWINGCQHLQAVEALIELTVRLEILRGDEVLLSISEAVSEAECGIDFSLPPAGFPAPRRTVIAHL